jgi:16S rRNA (uracil1498-N3)-methyltransferase
VRRFFINSPLAPEILITGDDVRHIGKVLRMQVGDSCVVVAPDGSAAVAVIKSITSSEVMLSLTAVIDDNKEPPVKIILVQGLPKSDKMDYIVQKAVELGVYKVIPMHAAHSVVQYTDQKKAARVERWQKIAAEAAKQCRRSLIPQISNIQSLHEVLSSLEGKAEIIMLYEGQTKVRLRDILTMSHAEAIAIIVGPEGGFSDEEVGLASRRGAAIATMGPRILRTETASVAAVAAVMYACGDLGG